MKLPSEARELDSTRLNNCPQPAMGRGLCWQETPQAPAVWNLNSQKAQEASKKVPEQRPEINTPQLQPQRPPAPEVTCSCQCCPCKCHYVTTSSAKLPRRFSAVQYTQQW
ncbi:coiled-coil domain-containing protein 200 isoform X1 [Chelonia mydas]|uniref:coiled-coil domain-containing protein 200 isoform X1 n=1 Tax=Chelonia mydas TaxID=8469 RepID=UPI001CA97D7B|nr:coiled-coil domain-containing protein 200 isoform X1 [Chelonia mydas]